jgi:hypothetical protein
MALERLKKDGGKPVNGITIHSSPTTNSGTNSLQIKNTIYGLEILILALNRRTKVAGCNRTDYKYRYKQTIKILQIRFHPKHFI